MTRVLILGGSGMLGHKLFQELGRVAEVYATVRAAPSAYADHPGLAGAPAGRLIGAVDAANIDTVRWALVQAEPQVVVNCIGIIKQLREAHDPIPSLTLNALLPHRLAELCSTVGARLIHISTDCVFTGRKGDYRESDSPDAEDLYGRSKLLGELDRPGCLTLRTSIIGRDPCKPVGLLEWLLSQEGRMIKGFTNAIYSGFPTRALAGVVARVIAEHPQLSGLYHVASEPISKYELLLALRDAYDLDVTIVPDEAFRCDRSLNAARFAAATGYAAPGWPSLIAELLSDPTPYSQGRGANVPS